MNIKKLPIDAIKTAPYNPRIELKPGNPEYEKLKRSIQEFGAVEPLVWNEHNGVLVGGHQRLRVMQDMGQTEVEVSVVNIPDVNKEKALNIALNRIQGDWDAVKLSELFNQMANDHYDLSLTGFEQLQIDSISLLTKDPEDAADAMKHWQGMPEYVNQDMNSWRHVVVHFKDQAGFDAFAKAIGRELTDSTRYMWFPDEPRMETEAKRY